jgi:hypothetical protein
VTSVSANIERQNDFPDASVDHADARYAVLRGSEHPGSTAPST